MPRPTPGPRSGVKIPSSRHPQFRGGPDDGEGGGGRTPLLSLHGYSGSLDGLLILARSRRIDLGKIALLDLVDQLVTAVRDAPPAISVG